MSLRPTTDVILWAAAIKAVEQSEWGVSNEYTFTDLNNGLLSEYECAAERLEPAAKEEWKLC